MVVKGPIMSYIHRRTKSRLSISDVLFAFYNIAFHSEQNR